MAGPSVPRCEPRPVAAASHARTAGVEGRHRRNPVQRAGAWRNAASAHGRAYDDKPRLHPFLPRHARRAAAGGDRAWPPARSEEHTSELQSLMRISYAVFCLKKKKKHNSDTTTYTLEIYQHNNNDHT